jgi:putative transposase
VLVGTLVVMASTLTKVLIHFTFSTKQREDLIPAELEPDLYAYVGGIGRRMDSPLLAMGGTANHVHMLVSLGKRTTQSDLMLNVKRDSSKWIHTQGVTFAWQDGYFGFSLGESGAEAMRRYIAGQKEHHATVDYKDEVREFLAKYGIEGDERYMWD